jgi:SRSO17 transposase
MTTERLGEFLTDFEDCFEVVRRKTLLSLQYYLSGLLSLTVRKNIERIAEQDGDVNYQNIQRCISDLDWSVQPVIDRISARANDTFSRSDDNALLIDESGFTKKGKMSVGVARQWNGRLGKVDNCQVAVFGVLSSRASACPINTKLYLPKEWTDDPERCRKAGVPEDRIVARTKIDLARSIVEESISRGVDFKWVGFDAFYGRDRSFLAWIEDRGRVFMGDVPENTMVRLPGGKTELSVEDLAGSRSFRVKSLRPQNKGMLRVEAMSVRVEVRVGNENRTWRLVVTREIGGGDVKYSLTNSDGELATVAYMQRQRFWVERSFEDAKTSCGMAQYQVRGWAAWHHHMTMAMLAMLFLFEERVRNHSDLPLLSCQDIVAIIDHKLFKAFHATACRIEATKERHRLRYEDIARRQRRFTSELQQI